MWCVTRGYRLPFPPQNWLYCWWYLHCSTPGVTTAYFCCLLWDLWIRVSGAVNSWSVFHFTEGWCNCLGCCDHCKRFFWEWYQLRLSHGFWKNLCVTIFDVRVSGLQHRRWYFSAHQRAIHLFLLSRMVRLWFIDSSSAETLWEWIGKSMAAFRLGSQPWLRLVCLPCLTSVKSGVWETRNSEVY
jgi:hypothetical protein